MNEDLRLKIVDLAIRAGEGHIPSSFSIVDLIHHLYVNVLNLDRSNPNDLDRDFFILSKGHGALALYVVLNKVGLLSDQDLLSYGNATSIIGGHPNKVTTPFVEASTGSLGHGFPYAVGISLAAKLRGSKNKIYVLLGDGECHEGSIWEAANIATNQDLSNLVAIVDWNESAMQLMPTDNMVEKWKAFGWETQLIDGHSEREFQEFLNIDRINRLTRPYVIIAKNIKGRGVPFLEGHGVWHHKIPNALEYSEIERILNVVP